MQKVIRVELRTDNSALPRYNRVGDWRPRYIVWPEYDGQRKHEILQATGQEIDAEIDYQWGFILEQTFKEFRQRHLLTTTMFKRISVLELNWSVRFKRFLESRPMLWAPEQKETPAYNLERDYINDRQHSEHGDSVYLLSDEPLSERDVDRLGYQWVLDRSNLLPLGKCMFVLGVKESVLEICLNAHEDSFFEKLETFADKYEHKLEKAEGHFLSCRLHENKADIGAEGAFV